MPRYKVTACRYETTYVEAEDEDDAVDKAYEELRSTICGSGYIDDYEVKELEDEEDY